MLPHKTIRVKYYFQLPTPPVKKRGVATFDGLPGRLQVCLPASQLSFRSTITSGTECCTHQIITSTDRQRELLFRLASKMKLQMRPPRPTRIRRLHHWRCFLKLE